MSPIYRRGPGGYPPFEIEDEKTMAATEENAPSLSEMVLLTEMRGGKVRFETPREKGPHFEAEILLMDWVLRDKPLKGWVTITFEKES